MDRRGSVRGFVALTAPVIVLLTGAIAPARASGIGPLVGSNASAEPAGTPHTVRVSVDTGGGDADGNSFGGSISDTGRYVAFESEASDLVEGDTNDRSDIFVRDQHAAMTTRVSVGTDGGSANWVSYDPSISATGRYVAFYSHASDLVEGDTNNEADVFVRDLVAGTTTRVSVDTAGGDASPGGSYDPAINATGSYVAFRSAASDLVSDDTNLHEDVFVRDLVAGTTTRVSVDTDGGDSSRASYSPSISADGRYVAFESYAFDLVERDHNDQLDVFVRDLARGTTTRVSVDTAGRDPDQESEDASISAAGRYVAFRSAATDLVADDTNDDDDVFVRDLAAGTTTRVSVDTDGGDANDFSYAEPSISATGRYVAFTSNASDLVSDDTNRYLDAFVRDLVVGATIRVSLDARGGDPNHVSAVSSISPTGRYVAFASYAPDLVIGDSNGFNDVFVRDLRGQGPADV